MNPEPQLPQPREVWSVFDSDVKLHENNRKDKGTRFVLVLMKRDLIIDHQSIFNVVPLSASAKPDKLSLPISAGYEEVANDFHPKDTSCAVVNFYQPLKFSAFKKYRGRIDETTYEMVKTVLSVEVIGYRDLDYSIA